MKSVVSRGKTAAIRLGAVLATVGFLASEASAALAPPARFPWEYRTIDGWANNPDHPSWGAAEMPFKRIAPSDYADGSTAPAGQNRESARFISNVVVAQSASIPNSHGVSDFVWQWGQFLDHDLDETPIVFPFQPFDIPVPAGDPWFDPFNTGQVVIPLNRSLYEMIDNKRQQVNFITAYIDASNVYGSDEARALELRTLDGTGRLKTSPGGLLPFNVNGFPNAPVDHDPSFFLAGDVRANEQVGLTAMHTLFVREHNFWTVLFRILDWWATDEEIYQRARAMVAAEMQAITYNEFLPILLGPNLPDRYRGYDDDVNSAISNEFATAAYRFGHSMLSPQLLRLKRNGRTIREGHISLADAFFNPQAIQDHGIEPLLRGLAAQRAQEIDSYVIDEVRNFLFGPPGSGGLDLPSLNIQRGRDHGLPSYNQMRVALGLDAVTGFDDISSDPAVQAALATAYASVDDIDLWVGGLAEDQVPGALIGETFSLILKDQFERLRDGDRFWYETYLSWPFRIIVDCSELSDIIQRNTSIRREIPRDVFHVDD